MHGIRRIGVLGSGVMGSGIAAHFANAGIPVDLLDIVPRDLSDKEKARPAARNRIATAAIKSSLKQKPAPFFHPSRAKLVEPGNLEDHLDRLKRCDLVIEAVVERLDIKRSLFERLEATVGEDAIIASNTSGLRIEAMLEGRSETFRKRFCVLHFFNPVRYMKLLEVVPGPDTSDEVLGRVRALGKRLGKGLVFGKDTPNFVGNRIGTHALILGIHQMLEDGLTIEDVDAITGPPMGHPKSASFRTADLVGLDTLAHVAENCHSNLPEDEEREVFALPKFIGQMVEKKLLGNKTKAGFYRKTKEGIEAIDPESLNYRPKGGDESIRGATKKISKIEDPKERLRALVADKGTAGSFAWKVLSRSLAYAARRIPEIADSIEAIDNAMRWGYNWELGPFESWDALGFRNTVERMKADGLALPASIDRMVEQGIESFYRGDDEVYDLVAGRYVPRTVDTREVRLTVLRQGEAPVGKNAGAEAWDLGDGVLGLTFKTKANSLDSDVIAILRDSVQWAERDFQALLITNQGEHFCVGANLFAIAMAAQQKDWEQLRGVVGSLQCALQGLKYSRIPVVAAPYGMTLGGGLEVCLACDQVQAAAETYTGLVEAGVGLIPGGCGNLNLLWRAFEGIPEGTHSNTYAYVTQVFKNIAMANVATSAVAAQHFGYFRFSDGVTYDRAHQLADAKGRALGLAQAGYRPPIERAYTLPGESGIATLHMMVDTLVAGGHASEHDSKIAKTLAEVLCGGVGGAAREVTEAELLELEREAFIRLAGEPKSLERMQHMLMHNKPLRN